MVGTTGVSGVSGFFSSQEYKDRHARPAMIAEI
jgi:hypothetical protein